ncbi:hypothetical protein BBO99_00000867 [Phytophthora kernoviae]|uniref:M96 mating-specific protein family n=2 Tax=Phytophthora kernoviae TaxID=325452 RepID=A0A3R7H4V2_9STRA|nr:hypothetical protein BBO99_00000867 [Phytophthora kernoviae]
MTYLPTDDDRDAFEAALSFVDEFAFEESEPAALSSVSEEGSMQTMQGRDELVSISNDLAPAMSLMVPLGEEIDPARDLTAVQVRAEPCTVRVLDFRGDIGKFQSLFRQLDLAYREIDAVFETNGLARMEDPRSDVHLREDVDGKCFEFFTHKVLPFGFHDTSEAVWNHFKGVQKHMGYANVYEKAAKNLDEPYTIIEEVKKELYADSSRADVKMEQVLRRYVEEDRDIVIRVSRSAPIEIKHKLLQGLTYHIRGYVLTKRSSASTPGCELSVLQLCSLISFDHDPETKYDFKTKRALTNFLIVHTAQHIRAHHLSDAELMTFFPVDDDTSAFEAALSFVDEYEQEPGVLQWVSGEPILPMQGQDELMSISCDSKPAADYIDTIASLSGDDDHASSRIVQTSGCTAPMGAVSDKDKKRRRQAINERKKLLRKAGVYGDPNRVRKQRTRDIVSLRQQMEKLQIDLETLKSGKTLQPSAGSLVLMRPGMQVPSMWKELAERQRHRRETSEHDNVRLRLAVERQRKVADSLSRLLQKRTSQVVNECSPLVNLSYTEPHVVHVLDYSGDVGEFQGLFRRLDTAYHELDAVFEANGLARMEISPNDIHMREGVDSKYLEFFTHKVLPFGVNDTAETTWEHFKGGKKHMGYSSLYEKTAKDLDKPYTIVENFTKEVYSNNARADVSVKQVVRRFVEKDRDIVIWVSRAVPVEIRHKMLRGLAYHFRGYAITKRSPASTPGRELSQLQLCSLISLDQDTDTTYDPVNLRALTNFLIVHAAQNIRAHRELIENALVDRSLRHRLM